jgi:hypothetical protein
LVRMHYAYQPIRKQSKPLILRPSHNLEAASMTFDPKMKTCLTTSPKYQKQITAGSEPFANAHPSVAGHRVSTRTADESAQGIPITRGEMPARRYHPRAGTMILARKKK